MDLWERLGVRPVINALGTVTILGGSLMPPPVVEAMAVSVTTFVDLPDLLERSGRYIADLIGVDAAFITSGAASGILLSTAATMTGSDPARIARLPDTTGIPNQVIVERSQRNSWERMALLAGARIVEVDTGATPDALERAITPATAAVLHFTHLPSALGLADGIAIAHRRGVPMIVDAAAELPPTEHLHFYTDMGADLVIFSGGKMLRGPQSTGLVLGRRDLIAACAANANPYAAVGRPAKVGKEEVAGLIRAVELFVAHDWSHDMERWEATVAIWLAALHPLAGCHVRRIFPGVDGILPRDVPRVYITWDATTIGFDPAAIAAHLRRGTPAVAVGIVPDGIMLNPITLEEGEAEIVAHQVALAFAALRP